MIEIRYGDYCEQADISGMSVAEAREHFKSAFDIPDKAKAIVNTKGLKKNQESVTTLEDCDQVCFKVKSNRNLFLVTAMLAALAATGGVFAYTATTDTASMNLVAKGEFATVNGTPGDSLSWNVWGHYKGVMKAGDLFEITPEADYTGDLSATIVLANAADMVSAYKLVVMEISVYGDNGAGSANLTDQIGTTEYLTLGRGEVSIDLSGFTATPLHVYLDSGFYNTYHGWGAGKEDITLLCDVGQKGVVAQ